MVPTGSHFFQTKETACAKAKWWERTAFWNGLRVTVPEEAGESREQVMRGLLHYARVWNKEYQRVWL